MVSHYFYFMFNNTLVFKDYDKDVAVREALASMYIWFIKAIVIINIGLMVPEVYYGAKLLRLRSKKMSEYQKKMDDKVLMETL